jgi:hypothetical protein
LNSGTVSLEVSWGMKIDREGNLIRAWLSYALWVPAVETAELARLLGMPGNVGGTIQAIVQKHGGGTL